MTTTDEELFVKCRADVVAFLTANAWEILGVCWNLASDVEALLSRVKGDINGYSK